MAKPICDYKTLQQLIHLVIMARATSYELGGSVDDEAQYELRFERDSDAFKRFLDFVHGDLFKEAK